jgi:hypothetical protein
MNYTNQPIFSNNSQQQRRGKKGLVFLAVPVVAVLSIAALIFSGTATAMYKQPAARSCKAFVSDITEGKLRDAYNSSDAVLKKAQTKEEFSQTLSGLQRSGKKITYNATRVDLVKNDRNTAVCSFNVDGIEAPKYSERSDADFFITVNRSNISWKVSSATVK